MAHYPGYTVLRTEDCPEQHGTLTLLTHDVSGAAVLLVENEDTNKAFGIGFGTFTPYWRAAKNTRSVPPLCSCSKAAWHPSSMR